MGSETELYDVIVVYSESLAKSATDKRYRGPGPFSSTCACGIYNDSYRCLLRQCRKIGLRVAFATSKDIIGPGTFRGFWTCGKKWLRHHGTARSRIIFDRFTPATAQQEDRLELLMSSASVTMFNERGLTRMFQNKLNTYRHFKEFAIPTTEIQAPTKRKIVLAKTELDRIIRKHRHSEDFNAGYIVKDETGAGGFAIFCVDFDTDGLEKIIRHYKADKKNKALLSYILQPFVDCGRGFVLGKYRGLIDLRVILLNRKILQTYIRIAAKGKVVCNEHQGGNLVYLPHTIIPKNVLDMVKKMTKKINASLNLKHSLYALDFIRSNNGNVYFLEGNTNPGIDWNHAKKTNEMKSKELIRCIAHELKIIVQETARQHTRGR